MKKFVIYGSTLPGYWTRFALVLYQLSPPTWFMSFWWAREKFWSVDVGFDIVKKVFVK